MIMKMRMKMIMTRRRGIILIFRLLMGWMSIRREGMGGMGVSMSSLRGRLMGIIMRRLRSMRCFRLLLCECMKEDGRN